MAGFASFLGFWYGGLQAEAAEENTFDECNPDAATTWADCSSATTVWTPMTTPSTTWG